MQASRTLRSRNVYSFSLGFNIGVLMRTRSGLFAVLAILTISQDANAKLTEVVVSPGISCKYSKEWTSGGATGADFLYIGPQVTTGSTYVNSAVGVTCPIPKEAILDWTCSTNPFVSVAVYVTDPGHVAGVDNGWVACRVKFASSSAKGAALNAQSASAFTAWKTDTDGHGIYFNATDMSNLCVGANPNAQYYRGWLECTLKYSTNLHAASLYGYQVDHMF